MSEYLGKWLDFCCIKQRFVRGWLKWFIFDWVFFRPVITKQGLSIMAKVCQVTGKRPVTGNNVSHSNIKTKRRFLPNLHTHRFWVESEKRFVKLRVSTKGMRIIDKKGIETVLGELRARGEKV